MGAIIKLKIKKVLYFIYKRIHFWITEVEADNLKQQFATCGEGFFVHTPYVISGAKKMHIGKNVHLGSYVQIWGEGGIEVGNDCLVASHVTITSITHSTTAKKFNQQNVASPIKIGNNVWIGTHAVILPGVVIGNNCIIGAGAIIRTNIPDNSIVVGMPGKVIKKLSND